ncbi:MAG: hypothetical protein ChlgKO_02130 [Chlamydiales bacterium]
MFFDVSYLFLRAEIDGLVFGQTIDVSNLTSPSDVLHVKDRPKNLDFQWSSGLTAGVGYIFPEREQFQLSAYWTYLHSKADKKTRQNGNIDEHFIAPNWLPLLLGSTADRAKASWTLNFNVVDLALSRNVLFGEWFSMEPKAGLRGAWINQDYNVNYHGGFKYSEAGTTNTIFKDTSFKATNDYRGIGARIGSDLQFYLTKNITVLGSFFGSLLYGDFELRETYSGGLLVDFGAGPQILNEDVDLRKDITAVRPAIESKIGLRWNRYFNENKQRILIGMYYQLNYWFDQNELVNQLANRDSTPISGTAITANNNITNINPHGNLQIQGLEVELRLDF